MTDKWGHRKSYGFIDLTIFYFSLHFRLNCDKLKDFLSMKTCLKLLKISRKLIHLDSVDEVKTTKKSATVLIKMYFLG